MNKRETFLNYVRNGGAPICSPQIGAGAGFDTKLAGKDSVWDTTFEDTIAAVERFDIVPLLNGGPGDATAGNPGLAWKEIEVRQDEEGRTFRTNLLSTPKGDLTTIFVQEKLGGFGTKSAVQGVEDLDALEWYIDASMELDYSPCTRHVEYLNSLVGDKGALSVQWSVQPYELLCFPSTVDTVMIAHDCPERMKKLMDKILVIDQKMMEAVAKGGADFIFLGGPGSEMISPDYYEEFMAPWSKQATDIAHSYGLLVYAHFCSPIEPFLTMGYYNQMGIDLFETLSPPPVGNVKSMADAMTKIDPNICTRGNMGLDVLLQATPEAVKEKSFEILEHTKGRKHMLAASDYLFYGVPEENVHAMAEAVREFNG